MHTVVVGAGFGGFRVMAGLAKDKSQKVTIIDRHDYNFFPPLIYQVAAGFLSPSDISYPLRKYIVNHDNVSYRQGILQAVDTQNNQVILDNGTVSYDQLVIATGAEPNFFGNANIEKYAFPMKRLSDALTIRNRLLSQFNHAATLPERERKPYLNIVVAGGGPSGVELAGVLAEIRNDIFAREYPEFKRTAGRVELITADPELLMPMSEKSQQYAKEQLEAYGVKLTFSDPVKDYDGTIVTLFSGRTIEVKTLIWTAGVQCVRTNGFNDDDFSERGNRFLVDNHLKLNNYDNIYALGDIALCLSDEKYPRGHPQLGQVAMSQGKYLGKNLHNGKATKPYAYKHRGDMAMVGRLKAVADINSISFDGFTAWVTWVWIHIIALSTAKNRIATTYNWMIAFFTRNQSMRMEIGTASVEQKKAQALADETSIRNIHKVDLQERV